MTLQESKYLINKRGQSVEPTSRSSSIDPKSCVRSRSADGSAKVGFIVENNDVKGAKEEVKVCSDDVKNIKEEVKVCNSGDVCVKSSRIAVVVKKIMSDVEKISKEIEGLSNIKTNVDVLLSQKGDTASLKLSHKQHIEDTQANWAVLNDKIKNLEEANKGLIEKINEIENV